MGNRLEPVYDGFSKLPELGGVFPRECFDEPGIGEGVPGKIGKSLSTHVNPDDVRSDRRESASVVGFGAVSDVAIGMSGEPLIEIRRFLYLI